MGFLWRQACRAFLFCICRPMDRHIEKFWGDFDDED